LTTSWRYECDAIAGRSASTDGKMVRSQ